MRVIVLGCGPAGLLAAYACAVTQNEVMIVSEKSEMSDLIGNPWLRSPLPGIHDNKEPEEIKIVVNGDMTQGLKKAGIADPRTHPLLSEIYTASSDSSFVRRIPFWSIRDCYQILCNSFLPTVTETGTKINAAIVLNSINDLKPDFVVSTIPASALCSNIAHSFPFVETMTFTEQLSGTRNCISLECDLSFPSFFIRSEIDGRVVTEWKSGAKRPPYVPTDKLSVSVYPAGTTCNCMPLISRLGMYGRWSTKDTFNVFSEALRILNGPSIGDLN